MAVSNADLTPCRDCWFQETSTARTRTQEAQPGQVVKKPEVIDDFLRNFFIKMGLSRTCECFEAEWYELKATGRLDSSTTVPDVYLRNAVSLGSRLPTPHPNEHSHTPRSLAAFSKLRGHGAPSLGVCVSFSRPP